APVATCLFAASVDPRDLHSFPTRRSSDLQQVTAAGCAATRLTRRAGRAPLSRSAPAAPPPPAPGPGPIVGAAAPSELDPVHGLGDRKSTRLNSSHDQISYAVFCLKKKNQK